MQLCWDCGCRILPRRTQLSSEWSVCRLQISCAIRQRSSTWRSNMPLRKNSTLTNSAGLSFAAGATRAVLSWHGCGCDFSRQARAVCMNGSLRSHLHSFVDACCLSVLCFARSRHYEYLSCWFIILDSPNKTAILVLWLLVRMASIQICVNFCIANLRKFIGRLPPLLCVLESC